MTQQGVRVDKARSNFLLFTILSSDDPDFDPIALGDYASRNVLPEIQRIPGVGQAQLFGTERAMRIWIDPAKLVGFNLSPADVNAAIRAQNAQVVVRHDRRPADRRRPGRSPRPSSSPASSSTVEQFGNIVLRANTDGSTVRLSDVARIELGGAELRHLGAPERQAVHRHRRAAVADRQRAGHRRARSHAHGASWRSTSRRA